MAYFASADFGCYRVLGWPMPSRILDPYVEFRACTNGLSRPMGSGLLGALAYFGLDGIGADEKSHWRDLILTGGPWSDDGQIGILDYCQDDVDALDRLLPAMADRIDLPRALLRGRYMAAVSAMEIAGVPIDVASWKLLRDHWTDIQDDIIKAIDRDYGAYDGRSFRKERFNHWLAAHGIPWPRLKSGQLDLSDETFRQMARAYPSVSPLRELRSSLSDLRLAGRCYCSTSWMISAFSDAGYLMRRPPHPRSCFF